MKRAVLIWLLAVVVAGVVGCGGEDGRELVRVSLDEWQAGDCSSADSVIVDAGGTTCAWACASFQTPLGWTIPSRCKVRFRTDGAFDHALCSGECRSQISIHSR